ncbi:MAG: hypothetical protein EBR82_07195 [Caulobacteraceae bacterium]|nr:hypothetical protein [Caulobacteraceae bacterium]
MSFLKELATALQNGGLDEVPDGWETAERHAAEAGLSTPRTAEILKRGVSAGLVEVKKFRIMAGGRPYPVPHYRKVVK